MNRQGKIILPVLIVLIIMSFWLTIFSFYLYQKEHAQNIKLQEQVTELDSRQRITEGKLADAKKLASELALKLQESNAKIDSLSEELSQEKTKYNEASTQLEQFKSDLEQQKSLRQDLENKFKTTQDEGKQIKEQIKIMQQQKAELENKIKSMEDGSAGVELGRVIVNNEPVIIDNTAKGKAKEANDKIKAAQLKQDKANKVAKIAEPIIYEGKVLIVNKEFNFVVINLGSKDNIKLGDEFSVLSASGNPIGDLKVEKVHEAMSAAGFPAEIKDLLKENDRIVKKVK